MSEPSQNGSGLTTASIYERLKRLQIQGDNVPRATASGEVIHRPTRVASAPEQRRNRPRSLMMPAGPPSATPDRRPRPQSLIMTSRRTAPAEAGERRDVRGAGGLEFSSRRALPLTLAGSAPNYATNGGLVQNPFDLENFKDEIRIDGTKYEVSAIDFESIRPLGEGACGSVQEMLHKPTGTMMAVKRMRRTQDLKEQKRIFTDLNIVIKEHTCENLIKSYGAYITETDVCICMEPMDTCLDKLQKKMAAQGIQGIPENVLGKITVGVVHGLDYLKRNYSVIHRDVKPSNILLRRNGDVKVCDFGIAGNLVDSKARTRDQGCPAYMSPERIDPPDQLNPSYDIRADVWSLGITLIELATGRYPYNQAQAQFSLMTDILSQPPPSLSTDDGFSESFVDFVRNCLIKDVTGRPKYDKLIQHPFITTHKSVDKKVIANWYCSNFL